MSEVRDYEMWKVVAEFGTIRAKFWKGELVEWLVDVTRHPKAPEWAAVNPVPYTLAAFNRDFPTALRSKYSKREEKLARFQHYYRQRHQSYYTERPHDLRVLANVEVTDELLHVYFYSKLWFTRNGHSVQSYADNINEVQATLQGTTDAQKSKHPDRYDEVYDSKLTPEQGQDYRAHLKSLGWAQSYSPGAGTTWKPPKPTP